ncbi:MAG: hypothetical protein KGH75_04810 [Rhodospirillales bacterium]|nr:hypothetical protein [Rhodospirillales bacterium]
MILLSPSDQFRPSKAYALIKFFSERDHSEQFLDGSLFMRRLSYFRREEDAEGRWDSTEGVWSWLQKKDLRINMNIPSVGAISITERDLAAPVSMSIGGPDNLYIYCMYAYYIEQALPTDDIRDIYGEDRLVELEAALQLDPRCLRFGSHAVVIPWKPFVARLRQAASKQSLRLRAGLVHYYDDNVFNGEFKFKDAPFRKQKRFDYQREYRICVQTLDHTPAPRTINIGSLRGLGCYTPSEHLLKAFKLSLSSNV